MMRRIREILRHLHPNRYWVKSDTYVDGLGRTGLRYHEGDRALFVDSEWGAGRWIAIWPDSITRWDPPHQADSITLVERGRILGNTIQALERAGFQVDLPGPNGWSSEAGGE